MNESTKVNEQVTAQKGHGHNLRDLNIWGQIRQAFTSNFC